MSNSSTVFGVMLAGGKAQRMGGGDKCLLPLGAQTLLQRAVDRAKPQVDQLLLSANGNQLRFARTRLTVIPDTIAGQPGPLAGIYSALLWLKDQAPDVEWLASFASDAPFIPQDMVSKLKQAVQDDARKIAVARACERVQPAFSLWHTSLLSDIESALNEPTPPLLRDWVANNDVCYVDFEHPRYDPFFNINTPQDLYKAEPMLAQV